MKNGDSDAKLTTLPENSCTLEDIELVFKGVHDVWAVTEDGETDYLKETYTGESEFGYFYCNGCQTDWAATAVQDQEQAWEKVKEHLGA